MKILSFLEIQEKQKTLKVAFVLERTWYDNRLTFWHLKTNPALNVLWERTHEPLWYPKLRFENADKSRSNAAYYHTWRVLRDSQITPILEYPGTEKVANKFRGSDHMLMYKVEFLYHMRCVFDLEGFPFDKQTCRLNMKLPEDYTDFVKVWARRIEYDMNDNKHELTEYSAEKILFCSQANGARLVVEIVFGRPLLGNILTTFLPTLLLLVVRSNSNYNCLIFVDI